MDSMSSSPTQTIPGPPGKLRHLHPRRFSPDGTGQATRPAPTQTSLPKKTSGLKLPGSMKASRSLHPKGLLALYLDTAHPSTPHRLLPRARGRAGPCRLHGPGVLLSLRPQRALPRAVTEATPAQEVVSAAEAAGGGDRRRLLSTRASASSSWLRDASHAQLGRPGHSQCHKSPPFPFPSCLGPDAKRSAMGPRGARPLQAPHFPKGSVASRCIPWAPRLSPCRILCHRCHAQA